MSNALNVFKNKDLLKHILSFITNPYLEDEWIEYSKYKFYDEDSDGFYYDEDLDERCNYDIEFYDKIYYDEWIEYEKIYYDELIENFYSKFDIR